MRPALWQAQIALGSGTSFRIPNFSVRRRLICATNGARRKQAKHTLTFCFFLLNLSLKIPSSKGPLVKHNPHLTWCDVWISALQPHTHTLTHPHSLSLIVVVMIKSAELKTKICYTRSLILSLKLCVCIVSDSSYSHPHTHPITCTCCCDQFRNSRPRSLMLIL